MFRINELFLFHFFGELLNNLFGKRVDDRIIHVIYGFVIDLISLFINYFIDNTSKVFSYIFRP